MSDDFYRAFEDEHRGSRELIKSRQGVYLPFIEPLLSLYPDSSALDLGCGRGEWLELLTQIGFQVRGVDLDDSMLAVCRERGLSVQTKDAIAGLQECANESQSVVSGFHIAEHLPFEVLQVFVREALRVLRPGGLLILETPNPENIVVGTANFYLDPTHKQPIPPLLLSFLAERVGFGRVKVIRLQSPVDLAVGRRLTIHDVLGGVSPDYAIVAQKSAAPESLALLSRAFEFDYGVTLGQISGAYEQQTEKRFVRLEQAAEVAQLALMQAAEVAQLALIKADHAEKALHAIYLSTSWRVTYPLRWLGRQVQLLRERGIAGRFRDLAKKICRPLLAQALAYFDKRPALRARHSGVGGNVLLYDRLRALYLRMAADHSSQTNFESFDSPYVPALIATKPTQAARQVHHELKSAIERAKADH